MLTSQLGAMRINSLVCAGDASSSRANGEDGVDFGGVELAADFAGVRASGGIATAFDAVFAAEFVAPATAATAGSGGGAAGAAGVGVEPFVALAGSPELGPAWGETP